MYEAILQEEARQPRNLDTLPLRFRRRSQETVECGPELFSELAVIGEVTPTVLVHPPDPKHSLESPQGHAKGTRLGIPPVADPYDDARVRIYVDVVLEEVSVVGHQWPVLITDTRELGYQGIQRRVEAFGKPPAQPLEL